MVKAGGSGSWLLMLDRAATIRMAMLCGLELSVRDPMWQKIEKKWSGHPSRTSASLAPEVRASESGHPPHPERTSGSAVPDIPLPSAGRPPHAARRSGTPQSDALPASPGSPIRPDRGSGSGGAGVRYGHTGPKIAPLCRTLNRKGFFCSDSLGIGNVRLVSVNAGAMTGPPPTRPITTSYAPFRSLFTSAGLHNAGVCSGRHPGSR